MNCTGYGWISIYLFIVGFVLAIAMDLYVIHKARPHLPELAFPGLGSASGSVKAFWTLILARRMLAFLIFQYRRGSATARTEIADLRSRCTIRCCNRKRARRPLQLRIHSMSTTAISRAYRGLEWRARMSAKVLGHELEAVELVVERLLR